MTRLKRLWDSLWRSFWFLPAMIVAASIAISVALIELDATMSGNWLDRWPRLFGASADGARGMLSTIAGSMMTVVGVTFSMTLMTLALASSQYTSRILRTFMGDRATQIALGLFAGVFAYSLVTLRTIRGEDSGAFIPTLAVTFGFLLAIGAISTLIYFIHHVATLIQASTVISAVSEETIRAIDRLFPDRTARGRSAPTGPALDSPDSRAWQRVPAGKAGFVQSIDHDALRCIAGKQGVVVRMVVGVGEFVVQGATVVAVSTQVPLDEDAVESLQQAFCMDRFRTVEQDPAFGIRQIVDMALRALSPGVNDTTTAVMCVDYLTAILSHAAELPDPDAAIREQGQLRVITRGPDFAGLVEESFEQIRSSARGNVSLLLKMLDALSSIAGRTQDPSRRRLLALQVDWMAEAAAHFVELSHDRDRFSRQLETVREAMRRDPG